MAFETSLRDCKILTNVIFLHSYLDNNNIHHIDATAFYRMGKLRYL